MNSDARAAFPSAGTCRYRICAQGRVAQMWIDAFEGMATTTTTTPDGTCLTTLEGTLPDQAALVGILNSLYDLRLAILSVECVANLGAEDAGNQPR